jgi:hypothetical protein
MFRLKLITENGVTEELDFDTEYYQYFVPLDEDTSNLNFTINIKNNLPINSPGYPKTLVFKVSMSPSIFPSDNKPVYINATVNNSSSVVFSSDNNAISGDSYIGVIFSDDIDLIINFSNSDELQNKFLLVPYSIKPQEEANINFSVYYQEVESSENFSRNKFYRIEKILYDSSKSFVSILESDYNFYLSKFYESYALGDVLFLINPGSLQNNNWDIKNLLLLQLVANGLEKEANGSLNSFVLNYEKNILSNCLISTVSSGTFPFFSTNIIFNTLNLQTNSVLGVINSKEYFKNLLYFVIYEITKPYLINLGYYATTAYNNVEKISNLLYSLLSNGFSNNVIKQNIDLANGVFYGANISEDEKNKYFVSFYLISKFFVQFVYKLQNKGYISTIPTSLTSLENWLDSHITYYVDATEKINNFNNLDDSYELDFILTLTISTIFYSLSGKDMFISINNITSITPLLYAYFSNLARYISEVFYNFNANTLSLVNSSTDINALFNKIFINGFWNSFATNTLFNINLSSLFNQFGLTNQSMVIDYLKGKYIVQFTTSSAPTNINNKILLNGSNVVAAFPYPYITANLSNNSTLEIDSRIFRAVQNQYGNIIIYPNLSTKTNYLNYIHTYMKLLSSKIENLYFFSTNSTTISLAIRNLNTNAYLTYILLILLNNKETQNNFNIKFSLSAM